MNITSWLKQIREENCFQSDIHIDELSDKFKSPLLWVSGTIGLLLEADLALKAQRIEGVVAGAFSLEFKETYQGINFIELKDVENQFNITPPSLYFFKQETPWQLEPFYFIEVKVNNFPLPSPLWKLLFCEYKEEHELEYRRSLWIVPVNK